MSNRLRPPWRYYGADWLPFHPFRSHMSAFLVKGKKKINTEAVWTSAPDITSTLF